MRPLRWHAVGRMPVGAVLMIASMATLGAAYGDVPVDSVISVDQLRKEWLAADDYQVRQSTTMQMWRQRELSRDAVRLAARDDDREIASRANWILQQWRRGITPETPASLRRRLENADPVTAMDLLLASGIFDSAMIALEESSGTPEWEVLRDRAAKMISDRFPVYVGSIDDESTLQSFIRLVGMVATTTELAVCRAELMRSHGLDINEENLLPDSAQYWSPRQRLMATVQVLVSLGRIDEAIEATRDEPNSGEVSPDDAPKVGEDDENALTELSLQRTRADLLHACKRYDSRWASLLDDLKRGPPHEVSAPLQRARHFSQLMVAAVRAGDPLAAEQAAEALREGFSESKPDASPPERPSSDRFASGNKVDVQIQQLRWATLAIHGEIDQALAILEEVDFPQFLRLARACSRYETAFEGVSRQMKWINQGDSHGFAKSEREWLALAERLILDGELQPKDAVETIEWLRMLLWVKQDGMAWRLAKHVVAGGGESESSSRAWVIDALRRAGRTNWMRRFILASPSDLLGTDGNISPQAAHRVAQFVDAEGVDYQMWRQVSGALATLHPESDLIARTDWTWQLCEGQIPPALDEAGVLDQLHDELTGLATWTPQRDPRDRVNSLRTLALSFVDFFRRLGRGDLASKCLQALVDGGDTEATFLQAELYWQSGDIQVSKQLYRNVSRQIEAYNDVSRTEMLDDQSLRLGNRQSDMDRLTIQMSIIDWLIARSEGDADLETLHQRRVKQMLCSPSIDDRSIAIDFLAEKHEDELARQASESVLALTAVRESQVLSFSFAVQDHVQQIGEKQPAVAAKWLDLVAVNLLSRSDRNSFLFGYYPYAAEGYRLTDAIRKRDANEVKASLDRIHRLNPLDIDHTESLFPEMREAGMGELADETLDQIVARAKSHFLSHPVDVVMLNNLAWVLAINDRHLPTALEWSSRAVQWEPDSAVYRDTLAEILFRLGRHEEAIQVEASCVLDTPADHHLHQQIRRFQGETTE